MKSAGLALALAAGLAGAIAGYFALVAPGPAGKVTDDTTAARPLWAEVKWPFPIDQWGTGRAFVCKAADCSSEVKLYLRAKLSSCNCTATARLPGGGGSPREMPATRQARRRSSSRSWRRTVVGTLSSPPCDHDTR